jgi:2-dehydro-3-deoxygluconokinase
MRVVAAGECMLELARHDALWQMAPAGDSYNTALYLARLGANVRYLTALGTDPFSDEMLAQWRGEQLDTSLVLRDPERLPGLYAIRTDSRGERSFYYWRQHSAVRRLLQLKGIDAAMAAAADCDLLYLTGITLSLFEAPERGCWAELAAAVRQRGGHVAFDPNYRPRGWRDAAEARTAIAQLAPSVSILLTTDEDERALYGHASAPESMAYWSEAGVNEIVVKQGAAGATGRHGSSDVAVPVPAKVQMVDSTGAGDSFNAAYLMARLRGTGIADAILAGHRLAGQVVQVRGAILPR